MTGRSLAGLILLPALLFGCGSGAPTTVSTPAHSATGASPGGEESRPAEPLTEERLRDLVVRGVGEDFRRGTHVGPPRFALCLRLGVRRALGKPALRRLLVIARRRGLPYAAQALNALAVPIGDACGGRRFVPELTSAAAALDGIRIVDTRAHRLGLEYGPYIGLSCPGAQGSACRRAGIDVVLRREARSVEATVGGRSVDLVTPGPVPHDAGATGRDWGGYFLAAGVHREGILPVRLLVTYPGGRREALSVPHVLVSPGFG